MVVCARANSVRRRVVPFQLWAKGGQRSAGGVKTLVALRNLVVDCGGAAHVLQTVLMAYPGQARSLQGSHSISCDILAVGVGMAGCVVLCIHGGSHSVSCDILHGNA